MGEADDSFSALGDKRAMLGGGVAALTSPDGEAIRKDISVEEVVRVRASVVVLPALRVESGNRVRVGCRRESELNVRLVWHRDASSSILALAPHRSRVPDRRRARALRSLGMSGRE